MWGIGKLKTPLTSGEDTSLSVRSDYSSSLVREFEEFSPQSYEASSQQFSTQDDLVIIEFPPNGENLSYKLVLSGWKSDEIKYAFGTL
jgi:hypothetical protein